ncbi:MAG: hypothetical protein HY720_17565 [Planctomycetes bacterium]|nr:hypothetical protein [Planctomycetota bacterium]
MEAKKLRAVLLYSAGHLGSATVFNRLLEAPEFEIVGVVRAPSIPFSQKGVRRLKKHLKKVGWRFGWLLFWQQAVQAVAFGLARVLPLPWRRLRPGWWLARERGIPIFHAADVHDPKCLAYLRSREPDVLVSAYFHQILRDPVLGVPKLGILNVHPGWLPAYRGAMCYFWVLKNGEDRGGASVHWIDRGIDTGELLARRTFRIGPGATQQRVLVLTAAIGARLLLRVARKILVGERPRPAPAPEADARYYPMPGETDFDAYFSKRRFFRIRDVFGLLFRKLRHPGGRA